MLLQFEASSSGRVAGYGPLAGGALVLLGTFALDAVRRGAWSLFRASHAVLVPAALALTVLHVGGDAALVLLPTLVAHGADLALRARARCAGAAGASLRLVALEPLAGDAARITVALEPAVGAGGGGAATRAAAAADAAWAGASAGQVRTCFFLLPPAMRRREVAHRAVGEKCASRQFAYVRLVDLGARAGPICGAEVAPKDPNNCTNLALREACQAVTCESFGHPLSVAATGRLGAGQLQAANGGRASTAAAAEAMGVTFVSPLPAGVVDSSGAVLLGGGAQPGAGVASGGAAAAPLLLSFVLRAGGLGGGADVSPKSRAWTARVVALARATRAAGVPAPARLGVRLDGCVARVSPYFAHAVRATRATRSPRPASLSDARSDRARVREGGRGV